MPENIKQFWDMGGYGLYIWLAYGAGLTVMLINTLIPFLNYRKTLKNKKRQSSLPCTQNVNNV